MRAITSSGRYDGQRSSACKESAPRPWERVAAAWRGRGRQRAYLQDLLVHVFGVARVEGREAGEHLEDERPQAPPVDCLAVADALQHLGSEVLGRAAKRARSGRRGDGLLREAEVGQADVAHLVEEDVLRLQVAVDHVQAVQVACGECASVTGPSRAVCTRGQHTQWRTEPEGDLGAVEAHALDGEAALALEAVEELAARQIVDDHVQLALGLEGCDGGKE